MEEKSDNTVESVAPEDVSNPDKSFENVKEEVLFASPEVKKEGHKKKVQIDAPKPGTAEESSSSSNKNSSSSGNTGGTISSVDTLPGTQECIQEDTEEVAEKYWAQLLPLNNSFYILNLIEDCYTFGRAKTNIYCFDIRSIKRNFKNYLQLSKKHFTISRVSSDNSGCKKMVILKDLSTNGVYVNGELVGQNKIRHLIDKDEISLTLPQSKVFVFFDCTVDEDSTLPETFTKKYIMHKVIGKGAFGEVREVFTKKGPGHYAVKIIEKGRISMYLSAQNERDVLTEARLMLNLRHPCVISVHDIINAEHALYIILELAEGGELFQRLQQRGPMKNFTAKIMFYQMLSAVSYLHDNNVTHRDLKPENILLTSKEEECVVKITDFGMSRVIGEESLMMTQAGTRSYLAPEIIQHLDGTADASGYTRMVDSWSLGVILYMCIAAAPPFSPERNDTKDTLSQQILKADYKFRSSVWLKADKQVKDLIGKLLVVNPLERYPPAKALQHTWLQDEQMRRKVTALWDEDKNSKSYSFGNDPDELLHMLEGSSDGKSKTSLDSGEEKGRKRELSTSSESTNGSISPPSGTKKLKTDT